MHNSLYLSTLHDLSKFCKGSWEHAAASKAVLGVDDLDPLHGFHVPLRERRWAWAGLGRVQAVLWCAYDPDALLTILGTR